MPFEVEVQSVDFSAAPAASHVFTLPDGHTIARLWGGENIAYATGPLHIAIGVGDVFDEGAAHYLKSVGRNENWPNVSTASTLLNWNDLTTSTNYTAHIWNMNTLAPVCAWGTGFDPYSIDPWYATGMRQSAAKTYNQIKVHAGATITGGVLYCISYKRTTTVTVRTAPELEEILTGITKANGMIMVAALNCTFGTAQTAGQLRLSTGGVIQEAASDYLRNQVGSNLRDECMLENAMNVGASSTDASGFALVSGMMETAVPSLLIGSSMLSGGASGLSLFQHKSWIDAVEENDEVVSVQSADFASGDIYFVEYTV